MCQYSYRVKVKGGSWSRWASWGTIPLAELRAESGRNTDV